MKAKLLAFAPAIAAGLLAAGLVHDANAQNFQLNAQNFQLNPNLVVPQYAVCLPGFTSTPTTVGNSTTYVCRSAKLLCREGWIPQGALVEDPYHNPNFAYTCTPAHLVPR